MESTHRTEQPFPNREASYRSLFDLFPIPIFEQDWSAVKKYVDQMKDAGLGDLRRHLATDRSALTECMKRIKVLTMNRATVSMFGAGSADELLAGIVRLISEDSYDALSDQFAAVSEGKTSWKGETILTTPLGERRVLYVRWTVAPGYEQDYAKLWGSFEDITRQSAAENALREAEKETNLRNRILEIFLTVSDDRMYAEILKLVLEATGSEYGTFGYFTENGSFFVPAMTKQIYWEECQVPDKEIVFRQGTFRGIWATALEERRIVYANEGPFRTPPGHIPIRNTMVAPIIYRNEIISAIHVANKPHPYDENDCRLMETFAGVIAPILDARLQRDRQEMERKRVEEQLRTSLREKEALLREIHHRVKNNLAVMSSLLNLQAAHAVDPAHRCMFADAQGRIRAMALAHELLYRTENLSAVSIKEYVENLTVHLVGALCNVGRAISLKKEIEDVSFSLDTTLPLGFVLTELISNCLKHAFTDRRQGEISIFFRRTGVDGFELVVADDGVGLPSDANVEHPRSFGLILVDSFVQQLEGDLEIHRDRGTRVRIRFAAKENRK